MSKPTSVHILLKETGGRPLSRIPRYGGASAGGANVTSDSDAGAAMTAITEPLSPISARRQPKFYFFMSLDCAAIAFLGFAPTYWLRPGPRARLR